MFEKLIILFFSLTLILFCCGYSNITMSYGNSLYYNSKLNLVCSNKNMPNNLKSFFLRPDYYFGENSNQWLGGDNDNSFALPDGRYFWSFGDTLIGKFKIDNDSKSPGYYRDYKYFIHDTVGIYDPSYYNKINYYCKKNGIGGSPSPVFNIEKPGSSVYHWILSGSAIKSGNDQEYKVLLGLDRISPTTGFFKIKNTAWILIGNPQESPLNWKYKTLTIPNTGSNLNFSTSMFTYKKWIYILGQRGSDSVLSRVKKKAFFKFNNKTDILNSIEYLVTGKNKPHWSHKYSGIADLAVVKGLPGMSEASIKYNKNYGWYTLYMDPYDNKVYLYTASNIEGPWVNKGIIYTIDDKYLNKKIDGKNAFWVYAPKLHPELIPNDGKEGAFVFSYVSNVAVSGLWDKKSHELIKDYKKLYMPQLVYCR